MGTRSTISALCKDGKYRTVYCHWDGYLTGNGRTLLQHYNSQEKVEALIALGAISSLEASIECPKGHTGKKPARGYTVFYGRDVGEEDTAPGVGDTYTESLRNAGGSQEYNYRWQNGMWSWDRGELLPEECGLPARIKARSQAFYGLYEVIENSLNGSRTTTTKILLDADTNHAELVKRAQEYFNRPENVRPNNVQYIVPTKLNVRSDCWETQLPYRSGGCVMSNIGYCVIEELPKLAL